MMHNLDNRLKYNTLVNGAACLAIYVGVVRIFVITMLCNSIFTNIKYSSGLSRAASAACFIGWFLVIIILFSYLSVFQHGNYARYQGF